MKITERGASSAPPPPQGGAKEPRAQSSFDTLLAAHDKARTAPAEGRKTKSERHDHGVRAHGEGGRDRVARDARRSEHAEHTAPHADATTGRSAETSESAAGGARAAQAAPAPAAPVADVAVPAPAVPVAEPVLTVVPNATVAATVTEGGAGGDTPQQAPVPGLPVAPPAGDAKSAPGGVPVTAAPTAPAVTIASTEGEPVAQTPSASEPAAPLPASPAAEAAAQAAAKRPPTAADAPAGPAPAATAAEEKPAPAAPVATAARDAVRPVGTDRARAVAAPSAAVHDAAPVTVSEAQPASPAAALRGVQHAGGLQLADTVERLRDLVQVAARNGASHARLQLHPAHFGGIDVRLRATANGLTAKITAERPEAVQALQQAAAELRQSLQDRGLTVLDVEVALAPATDDGSGARDAAAQAGTSRDDLHSQTTSTRRTDAAPDTDTDTDAELDLATAPRGDAGAVLVDVLA